MILGAQIHAIDRTWANYFQLQAKIIPRWLAVKKVFFFLNQDPINFHIIIASFTMIAAAIHIAGHCVTLAARFAIFELPVPPLCGECQVFRWLQVHAYIIRSSPTIQLDPLELWKLTPEEKTSGMTFFHQAGGLYLCPQTGSLSQHLWIFWDRKMTSHFFQNDDSSFRGSNKP